MARQLANSDAFAALLGVDDNLSDGLQRFFNRTNRAQTPAPAPAK